MPKHYFIVTVFLLASTFCAIASSQTLVERTVFCEEADAEVELKIRLPKGHDPAKKYPVIYEFIYDHTDLIAAMLNNFYRCPPTIVVFPKLKTGKSYYQSPELDEEGEQYFKALKNDIIPFVEREYGASKFRIAAGLSMGADYANYVLRKSPELFKAYLIFAIEKPFYETDFANYLAKVETPKRYFIAVAEQDTERRISFANQLHEHLEGSEKFKIVKKDYAEVEHTHSLLFALPDALEFAFENYVSYRSRRSDEAPDQYYSNVFREFNAEYGVNPNENQFIINLNSGLNKDDDPEAIGRLLDLMYANENTSAVDFWNTGSKLSDLEFFGQAEKSFLIAKELNMEDGPRNKLAPRMVYTGLSQLYGKARELKKGYDVLVEGHERIKNDDMSLLFDIGSFTINNNHEVAHGIRALLEANENRRKSNALISSIYPEDLLFAFVSRGYDLRDDNKNALKYADKALQLNPGNKFAKEMVERLNQKKE